MGNATTLVSASSILGFLLAVLGMVIKLYASEKADHEKARKSLHEQIGIERARADSERGRADTERHKRIEAEGLADAKIDELQQQIRDLRDHVADQGLQIARLHARLKAGRS